MRARSETMYGLTQQGRTATCRVCDGVGAVLASPVLQRADGDGTVVSMPYMLDALIPCPGCFSDAAILTVGMRDV
jgi:hypothetical protein